MNGGAGAISQRLLPVDSASLTHLPAVPNPTSQGGGALLKIAWNKLAAHGYLKHREDGGPARSSIRKKRPHQDHFDQFARAAVIACPSEVNLLNEVFARTPQVTT